MDLEETHTGVAANRYYGSFNKRKKELEELINKLEYLQNSLNNKGLKMADYSRINQEINECLKKSKF